MSIKVSDQRAFIVILFSWLYFILVSSWPTSYWLDVSDIYVGDAIEGQQVTMIVDRQIHRPFYATWNVVIREKVKSGSVIRGTTEASTDYKKDAVLPENLTLDWWTNGGCSVLPKGTYQMTTTWEIHPSFPLLPKKYVTEESNVFSIY